MRALAVEDDPRIAADVAAALDGAGFRTETCGDGEEAWFLGDTESYDLIVLDLGLPGMDGLSVLKRWRAAGCAAPVLVLTARGAWQERVEGIEAGADDYLIKPFDLEELVARLHALLRRAEGRADPVIEYGRLRFDPARRPLWMDDQPVTLPPRERALLPAVLGRRGRVPPGD